MTVVMWCVVTQAVVKCEINLYREKILASSSLLAVLSNLQHIVLQLFLLIAA